MKQDPKVLNLARRQDGKQTVKAQRFRNEASSEFKRNLFKTKML
jgi:hypothetical protein